MKTKSFIKQLFTKPNIKGMMLILIIGLLFIHPTFAQTTNGTTEEYMKNTAEFLNNLMKFFSRSWMLFATMAGKFMTNDMIYGTWLNLDKYLRQIWNITKNFANFGLLGFLLYEIIQFISKGGSIQKTITKTLIAGILIQASWFIVGAVIDLSTVATTAVAAFPASFIETSTSKTQIKNSIETNIRKYTIKLDKHMEISKIEAIDKTGKTYDEQTDDILDKILPKSDSIAGPLIFIGASALKAQDMMDISLDTEKDAKSIVINFGLKSIILILYVITLAILLIVNIMRIGFLWIVIATSPLIILWSVFKGKGFAKNFDISTILSAIFKPVVFIAMLSLILIFVSSIQQIMDGPQEIDLNGVKISANQGSSPGANIEIPGINKTTINDKIFTTGKEAGKTIFANLIVYFATIFLLRKLLKVGLTGGGGPFDSAINSMLNFTENMAKTTPIFNGYGFEARAAGTKKLVSNIGNNFNIDLDLNKYSNSIGSINSQRNRDFNERFDRFIGGAKTFNNEEIKTLSKSVNSSDFFNRTNQIFGQDKHEPLIIGQNPTRENMFKDWYDKSGKNDDSFKKANGFDEFIKNQDNIKILHEKLGGDSSKVPKTYEEMKTIKYGTTN